MLKPLEIGINIGGMLQFEDAAELRKYAALQSNRLAGLMCVLKECAGQVEEMYFVDAVRIASDMAYEVQQAIELMNEPEVANV